MNARVDAFGIYRITFAVNHSLEGDMKFTLITHVFYHRIEVERWKKPIAIGLVGFAMAMMAISIEPIKFNPNSAVYIGAAQNLLTGHGLTVPFSLKMTGIGAPLTHYPPLYSLFLAFGGLFDFSMVQVAVAINVISFGVSLVVVSSLLNRATHSAVIIASCNAFTGFSLVNIYAYAQTEPLFIAIVLAGLLLLHKYIENGDRSYLFGSAASIGMAALTRYAGAAFIISGIVSLLFLCTEKFFQRIKIAAQFTVVSAAPIAIWLIGNQLAFSNATNRELLFHPISLNHLRQMLVTFLVWFSNNLILSVLSFALISVFALISALRKQQQPLTVMLLLTCTCYLGFLAASITLVDAYTPLDERILSPLFPLASIAGVLLLDRLDRISRYLLAPLMLVALALRIFSVLNYASTPDIDRWQGSEVMGFVRQLPSSTVIFSNAADYIYLYTGKSAAGLPWSYDPIKAQVISDYSTQMDQLNKEMENGAVVVLFDAVTWRFYYPDAKQFKCPRIYYQDGSVFRIR